MTSPVSIPDTEISTLPRLDLNRPLDIAGFIIEHLESTLNGAPL